MPSYIFFADQGKAIYAPFLKYGFRHCFCLISDEKSCCIIEKTNKNLILKNVPKQIEKRLIAHFQRQNMTLITLPDGNCRKFDVNAPIDRPFMTCVDSVKWALSIRKRSVLTPYQLYRELI